MASYHPNMAEWNVSIRFPTADALRTRLTSNGVFPPANGVAPPNGVAAPYTDHESKTNQPFTSGEEATDQLIAYHGVRVGGLASRIERGLAPHWLDLQRIRLPSAISVKRSAKARRTHVEWCSATTTVEGIGCHVRVRPKGIGGLKMMENNGEYKDRQHRISTTTHSQVRVG